MAGGRLIREQGIMVLAGEDGPGGSIARNLFTPSPKSLRAFRMDSECLLREQRSFSSGAIHPRFARSFYDP